MKQCDPSCMSPLHFCIHLLIIFFSLFSFSLLQAYGLSNETDRLALLQFKRGITSDPNGVLSSWNGSNHFCNWFGVSCGRRHERVVSLNLEGHNLKGFLSPYVGNLSFLRILNVQNNSLHGQIPSEIGNLFRLQQVIVGNNSLKGEIPANLSRCSLLEILVLQYNNLIGEIPQSLGDLANLQVFALGRNNLAGEIPVSLGNLSSLDFFSLGYNNLSGKVPVEIGRLRKLNFFSVSVNHLSGTIPPPLYNISTLEIISLASNRFQGNLPENLGLTLPNIKKIQIVDNLFSGSIPNSLCNATSLEMIDMRGNKFVGQVPSTLGSLNNLWWLNLGENELVNNPENGWNFLGSLINCTRLTILSLDSNNFGGNLPNSIGNLSTKLAYLYLGSNQITGTIPITLENLTKLIGLSLENNFLIGTIPSNLGKFQNLQSLGLSKNRLSGPIPSSVGNLSYLYVADLSQNTLEGGIPNSIKNCKSLQGLKIAHNLLNGTMPTLLPTYLIEVDLYGNFFTGHLPEEIGKLVSIRFIDVSENKLSGEIPRSIGECLSLEYLYLEGNYFQGNIPSSFSSLRGLQVLDLSLNNLTGEIPTDLRNLSSLQYLNLSFNDLEGEVPIFEFFKNVSLFSVEGNEKLCGGLPEMGLPKCSVKSTHKKKRHIQRIATVTASVALFVVSMSAILVIYHRRKNLKANNHDVPSLLIDPHVEVSYWDLQRATNGFSSDNLVGSGTFGLVYKGFLNQVERYVAIKVLKLEENGASKSFIVECKALRSLRHRNLVKLLTYCSGLDYAGNEFKALIFEFMENGSLQKWLDHNHNAENIPRILNFIQRLNIAIDVASALHYLHELCDGPIIHCDLKPSNILLDDSFVAHLSDFGLAKLFFSINDGSQSQISSIGVKGTIGYAPPEYGFGGIASKEGDVYSFGILVLELFSGKKPTHEMFKDGLNLYEFVKTALPQSLSEVMDPTMQPEDTEQETRTRQTSVIDGTSKQRECLLSIFKVGLACSTQDPTERQKIGDVVKELHLIRSTFLGVRIYG